MIGESALSLPQPNTVTLLGKLTGSLFSQASQVSVVCVTKSW